MPILSNTFSINTKDFEKLSELEKEASKWFQILNQCQNNFRSLSQNVIPALEVLGSEKLSLITESLKTLTSTRFIGSLNILTAKVSMHGLNRIVNAVPDAGLLLKEEYFRDINHLVTKREVIDDREWKEFVSQGKQLLQKLDENKGKVKRKEWFFPANTEFDFYQELRKIIKSAKIRIQIIDPYCDVDTLALISNSNNGVIIEIIGRDEKPKKLLDLITGAKKYKEQYGYLELKLENEPYTQHERFLIIDNDIIYQTGPSINHGGSKTASIHLWEDPVEMDKVKHNFQTLWESLKSVL